MSERLVSGRLDSELLARCAAFGSRALRLVEKLEKDRRPRRVIDQIVGASVGAPAHFFEASEALSRRDFIKILGIAAKELSESQYWLAIVNQAGWCNDHQLDALLTENQELLRMTKAMIARSKPKKKAS